MMKDSRTETVGEKVKQRGEDGTTTTEKAITKTFEEWTYNFGPNRFMLVVLFENDEIMDVRSGNHGCSQG